MTPKLAVALVLITLAGCRTGGSRLHDDETAADYTHTLEIANRSQFFEAEAQGRPAWVKFMLKLDDPSVVYFQDSRTYPFHYDFASKRLPGFVGMERATFDAVSLRLQGQKVLLGAVIVPPTPDIKEFAIQFVGLDAYDTQTVAQYYATVRAAVHQPANAPYRDFYLPTFEQLTSARLGEADLRQKGIEVMDATRWLKSSQCYSNGWTIGRVTKVTASKIDKAFGDGTLRPDDILLTDGIPAEVPPVRGIISLAPATPNSHVALLAQSFAIPFVFLAPAEDKARAEALNGRIAGIELTGARDGTGGCAVKMMDLTGRLPDVELERLVRLNSPADLTLQRAARAGAPLLDVGGLTDRDVSKTGGKAIGMALLRAATPEAVPEARVLTIDNWLDFLDSPYGDGTLGAQISARLAPFTAYPPDIAQTRTALKGVRKLVKDAVMPASMQRRILQALKDAGFDVNRKLRFRSSTNVEDTATFNGAGLYDSYSGCLADDLDQDNVGPSACDATDPEEKTVQRAIQKVYASFYNDNAFLERLRHRVKEADAGMGLLVHYSFPDADEVANGVVTLTAAQGFVTMKLVSQPGAASVTNPDLAASPEVATAYVFGDDASVSLEQGSSLMPLGAKVLKDEAHYLELIGLTRKVAAVFHERHPERASYTLDFEYKMVSPDTLILKQVREVPIVSDRQAVTPYLVGGLEEFCLVQGESSASGVFANQRLKSRLTLKVRSTALTRMGVTQSLFANIAEEHVRLDGTVERWDGTTDGMGGYAFGGTEDGDTAGEFNVVDRWRRALLQDVTAALVLRTSVPRDVDANRVLPVILPEDLTLRASANYSLPMPVRTYDGWATTDQDQIMFRSCRLTAATAPQGKRQERRIDGGPIEIKTSYWYPRTPTGIAAGYTAPLQRFETTTIIGLTTEPLTLSSYFSQAFVPEHHNFTEHFVFQPSADEGVSDAQRQELAAKDVRYIYANTDDEVWLVGKDGPRAP